MTPIIIGTSVTGDSHIRHNIECQDSYLIIDGVHKLDRTRSSSAAAKYYSELPENVKIIAVADGHGSSSCPYSKTGSQTAVNVFCDIMAEFAVKYKNNMEQLFMALNREGETTRIAKAVVNDWQKRVIKKHILERREIPYDAQNNIDKDAIWKKYGTTLLGVLITEKFIFSFQLGDGDITYVDRNEVLPIIKGDKILGVETHSISKASSWKKILTKVMNIDGFGKSPFMILVSTDGWVNSHASKEDFNKTCSDYLSLIMDRGTELVENNLAAWLSETSKMGCGDDITVVGAYFS